MKTIVQILTEQIFTERKINDLQTKAIKKITKLIKILAILNMIEIIIINLILWR